MPGYKVCVVGGAGGIGQPLSMLMAMDPNVAGVLSFLTLSGHRGAEQLSTSLAPPAPASRPRATPDPHASAARASSSRAVRVRPDDRDDPRGRGGRRPGPPEQGGQGEGVRLRQGRARRGSRRRVPDRVRLGARSSRCATQAGAGPRRAAQHQRGDRKEHRRGVRQVLPRGGHRAHRQPRQLGRARHVRAVEEGCGPPAGARRPPGALHEPSRNLPRRRGTTRARSSA